MDVIEYVRKQEGSIENFPIDYPVDTTNDTYHYGMFVNTCTNKGKTIKNKEILRRYTNAFLTSILKTKNPPYLEGMVNPNICVKFEVHALHGWIAVGAYEDGEEYPLTLAHVKRCIANKWYYDNSCIDDNLRLMNLHNDYRSSRDLTLD